MNSCKHVYGGEARLHKSRTAIAGAASLAFFGLARALPQALPGGQWAEERMAHGVASTLVGAFVHVCTCPCVHVACCDVDDDRGHEVGLTCGDVVLLCSARRVRGRDGVRDMLAVGARTRCCSIYRTD